MFVPMVETDCLLTIAETAETLRVSRATVYRLIAAGELPAHRVGQQLRIDQSELRDCLRLAATATRGAEGRDPAAGHRGGGRRGPRSNPDPEERRHA